MAHAAGTRVVITITDKHNPRSPVTVVRGYVSDPVNIVAICDDQHPVWHGCELRYSRAMGITFAPEPRAAMQLRGIKEFRRPVRCHSCRASVVLATKQTPHKCFECVLLEEKEHRRS